MTDDLAAVGNVVDGEHVHLLLVSQFRGMI
jgi:hypothetical protein